MASVESSQINTLIGNLSSLSPKLSEGDDDARRQALLLTRKLAASIEKPENSAIELCYTVLTQMFIEFMEIVNLLPSSHSSVSPQRSPLILTSSNSSLTTTVQLPPRNWRHYRVRKKYCSVWPYPLSSGFVKMNRIPRGKGTRIANVLNSQDPSAHVFARIRWRSWWAYMGSNAHHQGNGQGGNCRVT